MRTFVYRLYPTKAQAQSLANTVETCRRVYNDALAERKVAWETEKRTITKYNQLAQIKTIKATNLFAKTVHSHMLQVAITDLDKAFQAFFRRQKAGETPGYPRFKSRNRFNSFGLKEYTNGWKLDGRRLKLFGVGRVRVRWHRPLEGTPKTVRIIHKPDGWYACFTCDTPTYPLPPTGKTIGLDVGLTALITTSEGEKIAHPRWYQTEQAKLRRTQRRVARRKKGSANRRKAVVELQRQHQIIANRRGDFFDKLVNNLIQTYDVIAIEDLHITNMVKNRRLAKSILDASWGDFSRRLSVKAEDAGRTVVKVNPASTSQTCSACQTRFPVPLPLSRRWANCACGLSMDRDENAAKNILFRAGRARCELSPALAGFSQEAPGL